MPAISLVWFLSIHWACFNKRRARCFMSWSADQGGIAIEVCLVVPDIKSCVVSWTTCQSFQTRRYDATRPEESYFEGLKSDFADMKNTGPRFGGGTASICNISQCISYNTIYCHSVSGPHGNVKLPI